MKNADELTIPGVVVERRMLNTKKMFRSKIIIIRVSLWKQENSHMIHVFFFIFQWFQWYYRWEEPSSWGDRPWTTTLSWHQINKLESPSQAKSNFMLLRFSSLIPFYINVTISFDSILRPFVIQVYVIILKIIIVLFTKQSKRGNLDRLWLRY